MRTVPEIRDMEIFRRVTINNKPHQIYYKDGVAYLFELVNADKCPELIYKDHIDFFNQNKEKTFLDVSNEAYQSKGIKKF